MSEDVNKRGNRSVNRVDGLDTSSNDEFYKYYAEQSISTETQDRFRTLRDVILAVAGDEEAKPALDILDIGCGAGTFSMIWAARGHRVSGVDINAPLIELARGRAAEARQEIEFRVGTATELPFESESFDICCAPELLEHIGDAEACLDECTRVLRPGGVLYLSTTNALCPHQNEFNLPFYSWYPSSLKRHYEHLSVTTRPSLVNHAKYPAVHWFTFYQLRGALKRRGFYRCLDRFDLAVQHHGPGTKKVVLELIRTVPGLRFLGQLATPSTIIAAIKNNRVGAGSSA